ncbi:MAG: type VI secretion system tip protein TssI/VgrG [Polyangiaceae bacterium]
MANESNPSSSDASSAARFKAEDPFEYFVKIGSEILPAREARGVEGISTPFRFEFKLRVEPGTMPDPEEMVGTEGRLMVIRGQERLRRLYGLITEASLTATANGNPEIFVVLEPRLANLRHRTNYQVYRNKTVPEIVTEVLAKLEVPVVLRLRDSYKRRPYTVNYGEVELDFVHRLLEEEGIFYTFAEFADEDDMTDEQRAQVNAVVLGDGTHAYDPIEGDPSIQLRATGGLSRNSESVFELVRSAKMRPGSVSLRDWNLEKPQLPMDVTAKLAKYDDDTVEGPEFYDYPGKYELPSEGSRKARLMAEAFACASETLRARSDTARLMCGRTVELVPDEKFIEMGAGQEEICVVRVEHDYARAREGTSEQAAGGPQLKVSFRAIPAEVVYRPPRLAPRPIVTNPVTGIVAGPPGEDIHCDEFGRIKVYFPWDRTQQNNDDCSHWVPVLQENTGTSSAIPRIGWEVVIGYLDGDPDRPYVLGRVYNGKDVFPEPLPANKTKTALRSLSTPTRDGHNEIWIEDAAGRELMSVQAEKDQHIVTANDKREKVLNQEENSVVKDETITIGRHNTVKVTKQQVLAVDGNQTITVAGNRSRKVGAAEQDTVAKTRDLKIGGAHMRRIGGFDNVGVKKTLSETTGGVEVEVSLKKNTTNAEVFQSLTVGGAVVEVAGQGKEEKTDFRRIETVGVKLMTVVSDALEIKAKKKRLTTVLANMKAEAKETIKLLAEETFTGKITTGNVEGTDAITILVGGSKVVLNKDAISLESDQDIAITATGKGTMMPAKAELK